MKSLRIAWAALYFAGMAMIIVDLAFWLNDDVDGLPIVGVIGAAFMLLAITSMLNWVFKEAWEERSRANPDAQNDGPAE